MEFLILAPISSPENGLLSVADPKVQKFTLPLACPMASIISESGLGYISMHFT